MIPLAETLIVLLSWATHLSHYETQPMPQVVFVNHAYMVTHACYGMECNVAGWYNKGVVYIVDKYEGRVNEPFVSSLVVHEFVHYLQDKSGWWGKITCEKRIQREREAYYVQQQYIDMVLTSQLIIPYKAVRCDKNAQLRQEMYRRDF